MSSYKTISSTSFALKEGQAEGQAGASAVEAVRALIATHMGDYVIHLDQVSNGRAGEVGDRYELNNDGDDVGDSYNSRIVSLVSAMSAYVAEGFSVIIREDSLSDDRDEEILGGPTPAAIENFKRGRLVDQALQLLCTGTPPPGARRALEALYANECIAPVADIQVFAVVEGGALQHALASHPVAVTLIDYDTNGVPTEDLTVIAQEKGEPWLAHTGYVPTEVLPEKCAELVIAVSESEARKAASLRPRES
jgi:hypothetical protein